MEDCAVLPEARITERTSIAGTVFDGRYRIRELLGRGGMAEVYAATDERLHRDVALKVFPPNGAPNCGVERTRAELDALAPLDHPRIVGLYDAGCVDGRQYLALQYIDGPSLSSRIAAGGMTLADVAKIGHDAASALAYLHARGIVHRDIKPSNILLDGEGRAYLSDFGTARRADSAHLTATGETIGTASYLSPEQVRGYGVAEPTDIYALGLVLLECLTRRREYDGTPAEAAISRLTRPPNIDEQLPKPWRQMLTGMTDGDAAARPSAAVAAGWFAAHATVPDDGSHETQVLPDLAMLAPRPSRLRELATTFQGRWVRAAVGVAALAVLAITAAFVPVGPNHRSAPSGRVGAPTPSSSTPAPQPAPSPSITPVQNVTPVNTAPNGPPAGNHPAHGHGHGHGHG